MISNTKAALSSNSPANLKPFKNEENELFPELQQKPYQVRQAIGEGAFSQVYLIVDLQNRPYALKRLNPTTKPSRITSEICILNRLNSIPESGIVKLIDGFRNQDQISLVLEYAEHDSFRNFLYDIVEDLSMKHQEHLDQEDLSISIFTLTDYSRSVIRHCVSYMRQLLHAVGHAHQNNVIHRDLKPGNFLYSIDRGQGLLVDFGLAQENGSSSTSSSSSTPLKKKSTLNNIQNNQNMNTSQSKLSIPSIDSSSSSLMSALANSNLNPNHYHYYQNGNNNNNNNNNLNPNIDNNIYGTPSRRHSGSFRLHKKHTPIAERAGTRGFRAPEVLMRVPCQTTAIDMWSVGVIFICILSLRYPFFSSPDDLTALAEIHALLGSDLLQEGARAVGKEVTFSRSMPRISWRRVCERLSGYSGVFPDAAYDLLSRLLDPNPYTRITAAEALDHEFLTSSYYDG